MDIDKIVKAIEKDAGEKIPGLEKSLEEMATGTAGREYTPEQLLARAAREKTGLSQPKFAELIDTPVATVRDWEQGRFTPPGAALTLFRLIVKNPNLLKAS